MLKKEKKKQNNLNKKNEELKMKAYNPEINFGINSQFNKTNLFLENNNNIKNENLINNYSNFDNNYLGIGMNNSLQNFEMDNNNELKQNQTLNDFKQLLRKMDEKLNSPF